MIRTFQTAAKPGNRASRPAVSPVGLAFAAAILIAALPVVSSAQIYETSFNGNLNVYSFTGSKIKAPLVSDLENAPPLVVSGGNIYLAEFGGELIQYTTSGTYVGYAQSNYQQEGIAVSGSNLFVTNHNADTISEYSTSLQLESQYFIQNLDLPTAVTVSGGDIFVVNSDFGTIGEYTTAGDTVNADLISGIGEVTGIAVSGNYIFLSGVVNSVGVIEQYTTSGALVTQSLVTGLNTPSGITVYGSDLFVALQTPGKIAEYTTSGTLVDGSFVTGLNSPTYLEAVPEPSALVAWSLLFVPVMSRRFRGK